MQLDLTRYRQPVSQFGRTFQPSEVEQEGDAYRVVAPVQVNLEIHKDKDRFRLVGSARTELELSCSRCLPIIVHSLMLPLWDTSLPSQQGVGSIMDCFS